MNAAVDGLPRVSVVIPVKNGERYLAEAIESIRGQEIPSLEIVVVDDGSTDATRQIVERDYPECRYHYQDTAGPAAARNTGLRLSGGELIGFLDADDVFVPGGLAALHARLGENRDAAIAMGLVQAIHAPTFAPHSEPVRCYNLGCVLVRRAVFDRVGAFYPRYRHCEDVDWFMRAQEQGTVFDVLDEAVLLYRRHEANMSRDSAGAVYLAQVLKASLDRRRSLATSATSPLDEVYYVRPGRLRP